MKHLVVAAALLLGLVGTAQAVPLTLDCSSGCNTTDPNQPFGLAYWSTDIIHPSGTGVFGTFLAMQNVGEEDGHNTDSNQPLNDEKAFSHSVATADLRSLVAIDGMAYYAFALDVDERAKDDGSTLISLDQLKICSANSATLLRADDCPADPETYNLDLLLDRSVTIDYALNGSGNGTSDLFVYIPYAMVDRTKSYFYMYSAFGEQAGMGAGAGFEEWGYRNTTIGVCPDGSIPNPGCPFGDPPDDPPEDPVPAPEPASMMLLGGGLLAAAARKYRNKWGR
jgi:hypothetical protein